MPMKRSPRAPMPRNWPLRSMMAVAMPSPSKSNCMGESTQKSRLEPEWSISARAPPHATMTPASR
jgi:hypothetical protein